MRRVVPSKPRTSAAFSGHPSQFFCVPSLFAYLSLTIGGSRKIDLSLFMHVLSRPSTSILPIVVRQANVSTLICIPWHKTRRGQALKETGSASIAKLELS